MKEKHKENGNLLKNPKLYTALKTFMLYTGRRFNRFSFSEELSKQLDKIQLVIRNEKDCYTDFQVISIGIKFPYFTDDINVTFNIAKSVTGHEVLHIYLTSKKSWNNFTQTSGGKYRRLAPFANDTLNIVEDDRIEYWGAQASDFLKTMFFYVCQKMAEKIQNDFDAIAKQKMEESITNGEPAEWRATEKLNLVRNGMLYIRCTQLLPRTENEEVTAYLEEIYPYMLYSRRTKSTNHAVKVTHKIMDILQPLRDEFEKNGESKMNSVFSAYSQGSNDAVEEEALEKMMRKLSGKKDEEEDGEPQEDKLIEELVQTIEDEMEDEASTIDIDATSDDADAEENDKEESAKKTKRNYVDDITQRLLEAKANIQKRHQKKMESLEIEVREPIAENLLNDFLNSDKKTGKQKMKESLHEEKITQLNPVFVNPGIHAHCKPVFREKQHMNLFLPHEYRVYLENSSHIILEGYQKLMKLSEEKRQAKRRRQTKGRLDNRRLIKAGAFGAKDAYTQNYLITDKVDIDIMVLLDNSFSNDCLVYNDKNDAEIYRYEMNRISAIIQHEMLKRARISHAVWTFEEQMEDNVFTPMIDFSNCFDDDAGLYLKSIDAQGANRDGYALSYAADYLMKHGKNEKKLLIVISDGQPAGINGYHGETAMNDVKNTVIQLNRKGVKTIGIFTGDERENGFFSQMYSNHIFCNNATIQEMPQRLSDIITEEFKNYVRMS